MRRVERELGWSQRDDIQCCGVTMAQCHALLAICEREEISIVELAGTLGVDTANLSRTVDAMVRSGLVDRHPNPQDRRYVSLTLTDAGRKASETIEHLSNLYLSRVFEFIPREKHGQVMESLDLVASALERCSGKHGCCEEDPADREHPAGTKRRLKKRGGTMMDADHRTIDADQKTIGCESEASQPGRGCGCSSGKRVLVERFDPSMKIPAWVTGTISTAAGIVPRVSTALDVRDVLGSWKARWGVGRMSYDVSPGLYAVGEADENSPVFVSANYKMSFDRLRRELTGIDAWILVLDTKGINVWCAAGKGTFGTEEIVNRVGAVDLRSVVAHHLLILPQLGAPGVAAHEVHRQTGFKVLYGPVRASDIPAFIDAHGKATPEMREVRFGFLDRLVLTPIEVVGVIKPALVLLGLLFLLNLALDLWAPFLSLVHRSLVAFVPFFGALIAGSVVAPALLPFIPGRAFAWKGWLAGLAWSVIFIFFSAVRWPEALFYLLVLPAVSGYLTMNFTGASTYTSLSGVVKEMKTALSALVVSAGLGIVLLLGTVTGRALGIL